MLSETQRSGGVERLQVCVIFPFVRDTGIIQNCRILAAIQQGVCMPKRLLPLEGEEILLRCIHSVQISFYCIFGFSAINCRELHQANRGVCLM